jgi:enolase
MWENGRYKFFKSDQSAKSPEKMIQLFADWVARYPIVFIEDPMGEKDWDEWKAITRELGAKVELVGDCIFCTNPKILAGGIAQGVANSVLIKLNQLLRIERTLGSSARFAGRATFARE